MCGAWHIHNTIALSLGVEEESDRFVPPEHHCRGEGGWRCDCVLVRRECFQQVGVYLYVTRLSAYGAIKAIIIPVQRVFVMVRCYTVGAKRGFSCFFFLLVFLKIIQQNKNLVDTYPHIS